MIKHDFSPEQYSRFSFMEYSLGTTYLRLRDADAFLIDYSMGRHDELIDIHFKIQEAMGRLHDYLRDHYGADKAQDLINWVDLIRSDVWKDIVNTDIRPGDGEMVIVANEYNEHFGIDYAYYNKSQDIFERIETSDWDYRVFDPKNPRKFEDNEFTSVITHYLSIPDPPIDYMEKEEGK